MIFWKDFVIDQQLGPVIVFRTEERERSSVMEDARNIQETGQELRPARMVGYSSLESFSESSKEAGRDASVFHPVRTEGGA